MFQFTNTYSIQVNATYTTTEFLTTTNYEGRTLIEAHDVKKIFTEMHHGIVIKSEEPAIKGAMSVDPDLLSELHAILFYERETDSEGVIIHEESSLLNRVPPDTNPRMRKALVTYEVLFSLVTNSIQECL